MPIYEYLCPDCGSVFNRRSTISERRQAVECCNCSRTAKFQEIPSCVGVFLRGVEDPAPNSQLTDPAGDDVLNRSGIRFESCSGVNINRLTVRGAGGFGISARGGSMHIDDSELLDCKEGGVNAEDIDITINRLNVR